MALIQIDTLTHHGLGRDAAGGLHPRTLPGEEIDAEGRILTPSADRVTPPCRHFKTCGGCAVQHASDPFVARWKAGIARRALAAQGIDMPARRMHVSPPASRRRAKFSGRRTKKGALVGFHARASDVIVPVPECAVIDPMLRALIPAFEALVAQIASRKGEVSLTATVSDGGADLYVTGVQAPDGRLRADLAQWAALYDIARLTIADEIIVTRRPPAQRFGAARVVPPPGAFLQATRPGEAALLASARAALEGATRIVDLFAGSGTFTLPLAQQAQMHAYEAAPEMIAALDAGWRRSSGLHHVTAQARDLFRRPLDAAELSAFDGAVIDPPRAGAQAQIAQLAQSDIPRIAYISCNPISFARDAAALIAAGFTLEWVDLVDQFRWSTHVELAAFFARGSGPVDRNRL